MANYRSQLEQINIPFPERHRFESEILQDLAELNHETECDQFSAEDLQELKRIHSTWSSRCLSEFQHGPRQAIESTASYLPLVLALIYTFKEDQMIQFIRDGGAGMLVILSLGFLLLGREALRGLRLLIIKDHSKLNLQIDSVSVGLGCASLVLFGLAWTAFDLYVVLRAVSENHWPQEALIVGARESLTPLILSTLMAAMILLAHFATRRVLTVWRAPISGT